MLSDRLQIMVALAAAEPRHFIWGEGRNKTTFPLTEACVDRFGADADHLIAEDRRRAAAEQRSAARFGDEAEPRRSITEALDAAAAVAGDAFKGINSRDELVGAGTSRPSESERLDSITRLAVAFLGAYKDASPFLIDNVGKDAERTVDGWIARGLPQPATPEVEVLRAKVAEGDVFRNALHDEITTLRDAVRRRPFPAAIPDPYEQCVVWGAGPATVAQLAEGSELIWQDRCGGRVEGVTEWIPLPPAPEKRS